jgi:hypothetical protein
VTVKTLYLDQNAWVSLSRGAWDKATYPKEHQALTVVVEAVKAGQVRIPLSFTNIYETHKINVPKQRLNMARTQVTLSKGQVFRGRRRIFDETLRAYISQKHNIARPMPAPDWFLSNLWFEAASDYSPDVFGFQIPDRVMAVLRSDPQGTLFDYLVANDEHTRRSAVQNYTSKSKALILDLEKRRAASANEPLAMRKRIYSATIIIKELEFILATGRDLGLPWNGVLDLGPSLTKSLVVDVPILDVERELVVRLEDQSRAINENDLRDLDAFSVVLPLSDIVVVEKQFGNLARQANLQTKYNTKILTSVFDLTAADLM